MTKMILPAILGAAAVVATACGAGAGLYGGAAASPPTASGTTGVAVAVGTSNIGPLLVDGRGRTLYLFAADTSSSSTCYDACAQAWPPLLAGTATPRAETGVTAGELGTTKRRDGGAEVTYNGHPLYLYVGDAKPGDIVGQGLNQFGAAWYAVAPGGSKIDNG